MKILTWMIAGIVVTVLVTTVALDLILEKRPPGGWIYSCRVETKLNAGTLVAVRDIGEHGEGQAGNADLHWYPADFGTADPMILVQWFNVADHAKPIRLSGDVELRLRRPPEGLSDFSFVLSREQDKGGQPTLPAQLVNYGSGEFNLDRIFAFAGNRNRLTWTYAGASRRGRVSLSGMFDVAALRQAEAALPDLRRQLDVKTSIFLTACSRNPANRPQLVI